MESGEAIWPTFPQILALFSHSKEDFRRAGGDALSKLSKQGNIPNSEFSDMIVIDVPVAEFIAILSHSVPNLSHAEFRKAIQAGIPQIIALLSDRKPHVCEAGANVLSKLSEQGKLSNVLI